MEIEFARLAERIRLSGNHSAKQVYHLAFDVRAAYQPGDALAVFPEHAAEDVDQLAHFIDDITPEFYEDLMRQYDIIHPSSTLLEAIREKLSSDKAEEFDRYGENLKTATIGSLLKHFLTRFRSDELVPLLKKMRPRLYSITSSPAVSSEKIQLIVAEVGYEDCFENAVHGIASHYLSHTLAVGAQARVSVIPSKFKLPADDSCDVIMVGPGTGVAPFRSFLQEREARQNQGTAIGRQWLFFGDQHRSENFYYQRELEHWIETGLLTHLDLAFSRDQDYKIYVQDKMHTHAEELWQWISHGAYFYVCGNASRMAVDVETELMNIARDFGHIDDAEQFIKAMKREGRYLRDVY